MVDDICVADVQEWADGLAEVGELIAARFARSEPRVNAVEYVRGLLSEQELVGGFLFFHDVSLDAAAAAGVDLLALAGRPQSPSTVGWSVTRSTPRQVAEGRRSTRHIWRFDV